jgi:hypothetical protein
MVILSRFLRHRRPCPRALSARPLVSEDVCSRPGLTPEGARHRFIGACSSFVGRIPPGRGAVVGRPVVASSRGVDARCGAVERGDATCPGSPVAWLVGTRRRLGAGASARRPKPVCDGVPRRPALPKQDRSRSRGRADAMRRPARPRAHIHRSRGISGLVARTRRRDGVPPEQPPCQAP